MEGVLSHEGRLRPLLHRRAILSPAVEDDARTELGKPSSIRPAAKILYRKDFKARIAFIRAGDIVIVESMLERHREGIEIAKAESKYKCRKPVAIDETKFRAVCARWRTGEITATAAMQEVELKPNTLYRRVNKLNL